MRRLAHSLTHRGVAAWLLATLLTACYFILTFTEWFGPHKWTYYGTLYTLAVIAGGAFALRRYRGSRYQVIRLSTAIAVQVVLAWALPLAFKLRGQPELYVSYFWPLKLEYGTPSYLATQPRWFVVYALVGALVCVPLAGLLFGKRWYCSWVCGCGTLANTAGEPFRHLASKSRTAWKIERITIYSVLGLCVLLTAMLAASWMAGPSWPTLQKYSYAFQAFYGWVVATLLSGVIGVGLYPIGGTRIWCRYFCPMAALLGITQKASRFRIHVKPDMCISCGLCSTYCEMGIDVRAYAQRGESFTRAACVGCGMCVTLCPRGVLRLENSRLVHIAPAAVR